jgi:WD40 repeat protein
MKLATRTPVCLLLCFAVVRISGSALGGPVEDLLPPAVRQAEKRALGGDDPRRAFMEGRGNAGAAFSPDGRLLITGSGFQGVVWWDVRTGRASDQLARLSHNEGLSAAFTPDGKQVITTSWAGHQQSHPVAVWDVAKRQRLRSLDEDVNDTPFTAVAVAPDGKTIAFGSAGGRRSQALNIVFWDLASGDEIGQVEGLVKAQQPQAFGQRLYQALAYSPDGRTLAALLEGRVLLVELATGK